MPIQTWTVFRSSKGSWFVQALCRAIDESAPSDDLNKVLNRVKRFVSLYHESNVPSNEEQDRKKQIPLVQDTLIRDVYLKKNKTKNGGEQQPCFVAAQPQPVIAAAAAARTASPAQHDTRDSHHRNGKSKEKCKIM